MLVGPDEKVPIARLLTFLEHGERMAHDCAQAQAVLTPDTQSRRFLVSQARQEAAHAFVFQGAIAWLAPKHLGDAPFLPALEAYRWPARTCSKPSWPSRSFSKDWEKRS